MRDSRVKTTASKKMEGVVWELIECEKYLLNISHCEVFGGFLKNCGSQKLKENEYFKKDQETNILSWFILFLQNQSHTENLILWCSALKLTRSSTIRPLWRLMTPLKRP